MLKLNTVFGFALVAAVSVIGTHAWDTRSAKTETVTECVSRGSPVSDPRPRCDETRPVVTVSPKQEQLAPRPAVVCPSHCDELLKMPPQTVDANGTTINRRAAVNKKVSSKKKSVLVKVHHHKSKMTHHHKSKLHHHGHGHGGHGHGGHGHSHSPGAHYSGCPG